MYRVAQIKQNAIAEVSQVRDTSAMKCFD